jgi:hypothetical protein
MWLIAKRLRFMGEVATKLSKGVATNENGLGVEFKLKNLKA